MNCNLIFAQEVEQGTIGIQATKYI
jgi:hypothetical protein